MTLGIMLAMSVAGHSQSNGQSVLQSQGVGGGS